MLFSQVMICLSCFHYIWSSGCPIEEILESLDNLRNYLHFICLTQEQGRTWAGQGVAIATPAQAQMFFLAQPNIFCFLSTHSTRFPFPSSFPNHTLQARKTHPPALLQSTTTHQWTVADRRVALLSSLSARLLSSLSQSSISCPIFF